MSKIGILDIGSNTVRFVAYDLSSEPPLVIKNLKKTCKLGLKLDATGKLYKQGRRLALKAIRSYMRQLKPLKLDRFEAVATAAVRDSEDGKDFAKKLSKDFGIKVKILSGAEEAMLSAYGVLSTMPDADGLVADIGGGSLELCRIKKGRPRKGLSFPLGALRLRSYKTDALRILNKHFKKLPDKYKDYKTLYLVGGSWRAFAESFQIRNGVKRPASHGFKMSLEEVEDHVEFILKKRPRTLMLKYHMNANRARLAAYAALALYSLVDNTAPEKIVFSNAGLRDGLVFKGRENLPKK